MAQSTITLIIIGCTCLLYLTEKFPVSQTTVLGMLALVFTGVISFEDAFSCFSNSIVMLTLGMIIIANSLLECGIAHLFGRLLTHFLGTREKPFLLLLFLTSAFLSLFTNNAPLVAMFMPLIASVAAAPGSGITKKNTYLPMAMGALIGGTGSFAGGTAPLLANDVLILTGSEPMRFFTPAPISFSIVAVVALCYWFFLYDLQKKWFDFPEVTGHLDNDIEEIPLNKRHAVICVTVFLTCIVLFILQPFGWDLGLIAIAGALVLMLTGCVDGAHAMKHMQWPALVTLGAALAIAKGFVVSGVGEVIIQALTAGLGDWITNPPILVGLFLVIGFLLSQFMANGALVSMLSAIAVPIALEIGMNPMPAALACVFGCSMAMATPVATTTITMVQVAGYRFKDYFRIGGLVGLIGVVTAWVSIVLFYGLI